MFSSSCVRCYGSIGTFVALAVAIPAIATAEAPPHLIQRWGTHGFGNGQFNSPSSVAVDATGRVYVADTNNHRIQVFTSSGTYLAQWADLFFPEGVAVDASGDVYVADTYNRLIKRFTSEGVEVTRWGSHAQFNPTHLVVGVGGTVYVADTDNHGVQMFTGNGIFLGQWGHSESSPDELRYPHGLAVDRAGNVYVADTFNNRIQVFTSSGSYLSEWGENGGGNGQFNDPYGVAVDASGIVYVADTNRHRIQAFTPESAYITQWGDYGFDDDDFYSPRGLAVDASGDVYVADRSNHRILKFGYASTAVGTEPSALQLRLAAPHPNPSSHQVSLKFSMAREAEATLDIYDVSGSRVAHWQWSKLPPGEHEVTWNGRAENGRMVPSGVLFSRLMASGQSVSQRLIHVR